MYKQMNGRMADTLLYIDNLKNEKADIFQLLSRKDLADFAGISTESTVKLLKMFEKEGRDKYTNQYSYAEKGMPGGEEMLFICY